MKYDSLQGYLQAHLDDGLEHSQKKIAMLKIQWRREYLARYGERYRKDHVQITFRLDRERYGKLQRKAKQEDQKPTAYCRGLVIRILGNTRSTELQPLRVSIMELIDMLEQAEWEGETLEHRIVVLRLQAMLDALK